MKLYYFKLYWIFMDILRQQNAKWRIVNKKFLLCVGDVPFPSFFSRPSKTLLVASRSGCNHFPRTTKMKMNYLKNHNLHYLTCTKLTVNNQHLPTIIAVLITSEPRKLLLFHSHLMLQIETRLLAFTDHAYNIKNEEASFL